MSIPFLDRSQELGRLHSALLGPRPGLVCIYGRRRLGKSALLRAFLAENAAPYYVGDTRNSVAQRQALAEELDRHVPGFAAATWHDWDALLGQWWRQAPPRLPLVLDEFPTIVADSPELPGILQKHLDRQPRPLVICGSSQRMMHGLVLDAAAPLYGRAREILRITPLALPWIRPAMGLRAAADAVEHWAAWGGVPRYWELAAPHDNLFDALVANALDPLGVLHQEPDRLLHDDVQDPTRSASVLSMIGRGCHRLSEIAARLQVPATSLSRPLARLVDLGFVVRDLPFGLSARDTKRTRYRLGDPFLTFWYRFVEPGRSRLAMGQLAAVAAETKSAWPQFLGLAWEQIARDSVARLAIAGRTWLPASSWWGQTRDRQPLELDVVAECADDPRHVLVGEAKLSASAAEVAAIGRRLQDLAPNCPELGGRKIHVAVWVLRRPPRVPAVTVVSAEDVVGRPPVDSRSRRR